MGTLYINTDGGSRGNPGEAAIGIVFSDQSENVIYKYSKAIGQTTNNIAEYQALKMALEILKKSRWLKDNSGGQVYCRLDSQLVVEQLKGNYKVKNLELKKIYQELLMIIGNLSCKVFFCHVNRDENIVADKLVNQELDKAKKK